MFTKVCFPKENNSKKKYLYKSNVINNYKSTFINSTTTYFIDNFNEYIKQCIETKKVNGDKIENDILTIFNEDWRLLSLDIVSNFEQ